MSLVPRRIIGLHSRRQTIYWHSGSLNSTVSLPRAIHLKPYMLGSLRLNQHICRGINPQHNENNNARGEKTDQYQSYPKYIHLTAFLNNALFALWVDKLFYETCNNQQENTWGKFNSKFCTVHSLQMFIAILLSVEIDVLWYLYLYETDRKWTGHNESLGQAEVVW